MIVYAVVDDTLSPTSPLGDAIDVFVRRGDAERFIEEIRGDDPELAEPLRIEERELDVGALKKRAALSGEPPCSGESEAHLAAGASGSARRTREWNRTTLFPLL